MENVMTLPLKRKGSRITNALVVLMAVTCGMVVANIYYNQPLLLMMAGTFGASESKVSMIATITQAGYTLGLLLIVHWTGVCFLGGTFVLAALLLNFQQRNNTPS